MHGWLVTHEVMFLSEAMRSWPVMLAITKWYKMVQNGSQQRRSVAWLSGNALVLINEVTLRRARLVLGWVTVCERVNHLGM